MMITSRSGPSRDIPQTPEQGASAAISMSISRSIHPKVRQFNFQPSRLLVRRPARPAQPRTFPGATDFPTLKTSATQLTNTTKKVATRDDRCLGLGHPLQLATQHLQAIWWESIQSHTAETHRKFPLPYPLASETQERQYPANYVSIAPAFSFKAWDSCAEPSAFSESITTAPPPPPSLHINTSLLLSSPNRAVVHSIPPLARKKNKTCQVTLFRNNTAARPKSKSNSIATRALRTTRAGERERAFSRERGWGVGGGVQA